MCGSHTKKYHSPHTTQTTAEQEFRKAGQKKVRGNDGMDERGRTIWERFGWCPAEMCPLWGAFVGCREDEWHTGCLYLRTTAAFLMASYGRLPSLPTIISKMLSLKSQELPWWAPIQVEIPSDECIGHCFVLFAKLLCHSLEMHRKWCGATVFPS